MSSWEAPNFEIAAGVGVDDEPPAPPPLSPLPPQEPATLPPVPAADACELSEEAQALLEQVCQCPGLPALPAIARRIVELTESESATLEAVTELLGRDPVLAARVLRAANSDTYGSGRPITGLGEAVGVIGLQSIRIMTVGTSLLPSGERTAALAEVPATVRRRGVFTGAAARVMSDALGIADPDSLMLLGLIADVGMIALDHVLKDRYAAYLARAPRHPALPEIERAELGGACHALAGAALARHWRLPEDLALVVEHHHRPDELAQRHPHLREVVDVVALASRCADVVVDADPLVALGELRAECAERLSLGASECDRLLDRTFTAARDLGTMFDLPGDAPPTQIVPATAAPAEAAVGLPPAQEQRRAVRATRPGTISIFPYDGGTVRPALNVECTDLSVVSIGFTCREPMRVGDHFVIGLRRPDGRHVVIIYAIRRCDPAEGDGAYHVGAEVIRTIRDASFAGPGVQDALATLGQLFGGSAARR
jgi:HD-like signal output (HDOD) protein